PDEQWELEEALTAGAADHALVVTTGGTGLTPRDVTPQATSAVVDYEVPGLAEAMRAVGRAVTPLADLSRAVVGVRGRCLIVNLPGSPKGALESLDALVPVLDHALETLAGPFDHDAPEGQDRGTVPANASFWAWELTPSPTQTARRRRLLPFSGRSLARSGSARRRSSS